MARSPRETGADGSWRPPAPFTRGRRSREGFDAARARRIGAAGVGSRGVRRSWTLAGDVFGDRRPNLAANSPVAVLGHARDGRREVSRDARRDGDLVDSFVYNRHLALSVDARAVAVRQLRPSNGLRCGRVPARLDESPGAAPSLAGGRSSLWGRNPVTDDCHSVDMTVGLVIETNASGTCASQK
jgi:hypothetical protein